MDVVTYEFENLPTASFARMGAVVPVRPHWRCLETTQHRVTEKDFVNGQGIPTTPYRRVGGPQELAAALAALGRPAVLKTTRLGYDGKGQVMIGPDDDPTAAWAAMNGPEGILEGFVAFEREVSAIVARGLDGATAAFDVVENVHRNHILAETLAPAPIGSDVAARAKEISQQLADALDLVGLLAVEMFLTADGELLVNELAARPHNSGHWTIDACVSSQFEQFVRAVCRAAPGRSRAPQRCRDEEPAGRRHHSLAPDPRRALRQAPSLRQGPGPARPQDGSRHAAVPEELREPERARRRARARVSNPSGSGR